MVAGKLLVHALFSFLLFHLSTSLDTITSSNAIKDGKVLVSGGGTFALGFFSPGNSSRRYVGIWYNELPGPTVVWVANRDRPLNDTSGVLSIDSGGNIVIQSSTGSFPVWSTNVSSTTPNSSTTAQLRDSGNLVLTQDSSKEVVWQSFDYPTDTFLPSMKIGLERKTGLNWSLTSWKSPDDPAPGSYSCRMDPTGFPQLFLYKDQAPFWRAGPWVGKEQNGTPEMTPGMNNDFIYNVSFTNNVNEVSMSVGIIDKSILLRYVIYESGTFQLLTWRKQDQNWTEFWYHPNEHCDYYSECGPNGSCGGNSADQFECTCLPGFEPKSPSAWQLRDGADGCVRKKGGSLCHSGEGFVKMENVKLPDTSIACVHMNLSSKECEQECLRNCSCTAYSSADQPTEGYGCLTWYGELVDTRAFSDVGADIHIRVDAIDLARFQKNGILSKKVKVAVISMSAVIFLSSGFLTYCLLWKKKRDRRGPNHLVNSATSSLYFMKSPGTNDLDDEGGRTTDLPFFDFSTLAAATNNFSFYNELGQGGFGSVYKGVLNNGKEIAVKRLSKSSGQGTEEFKNEVTLIAKLQHRNLVNILGYCIHEDEKLLIYEYLPNKSLDSFLFDETKRTSLDWSRRFEIACGVARGLLYLHQDSRLRIIHRDLKASNVLLDDALNPKISDFGLARTCRGDQIGGQTKHVVGTHGYMSPEYALRGRFSVKSDVYSYGILLLEIITGKRNSRHHHLNQSSSLVSHVWELWKEGQCMQIVDGSMGDSYSREMVLRCIQIGLLCVQESAFDRPTMSTVVFMLGNGDVLPPSPKRPAFFVHKDCDGAYQARSDESCSVNDATVSIVEAR